MITLDEALTAYEPRCSGAAYVPFASTAYTAQTGIALCQNVPYRGTGPPLNDVVAGHVDFIFMGLSSALKLHEGGKARIPMRLRCSSLSTKSSPSQRLLRRWERR